MTPSYKHDYAVALSSLMESLNFIVSSTKEASIFLRSMIASSGVLTTPNRSLSTLAIIAPKNWISEFLVMRIVQPSWVPYRASDIACIGSRKFVVNF